METRDGRSRQERQSQSALFTVSFQSLLAQKLASRENLVTIMQLLSRSSLTLSSLQIWLVRPSPAPVAAPTAGPASSSRIAEPATTVEYLATLSRHTSTVNVVRFSPPGDAGASSRPLLSLYYEKLIRLNFCSRQGFDARQCRRRSALRPNTLTSSILMLRLRTDGNIIFWAPAASAITTFGSSSEDAASEKENWQFVRACR